MSANIKQHVQGSDYPTGNETGSSKLNRKRSRKSESICSNHDGGYNCKCHAGFKLDPLTNQCLDIDECHSDNLCDELICTNLPGIRDIENVNIKHF